MEFPVAEYWADTFEIKLSMALLVINHFLRLEEEHVN